MTHARSTRTPATRTAIPSSRTRRICVVAVSLAVAALPLIGPAESATAATHAPTTVELRASVVALTNVARLTKGCKPLKTSTRLTKAAQGHAKDMAAKDYFDHTSANGRTWDQRIRAAGWTRPAGENIAYGFDTPAAVLEGWMASPGHKRNILDCKFNYIGIGYTAEGDYWVQDFGY